MAQPLDLRCLFFRSPFGCKKGAACAFCHHEVTTRAQANLERPRQAERQRIRVSILELVAKLDVETQQPQDLDMGLKIVEPPDMFFLMEK